MTRFLRWLSYLVPRSQRVEWKMEWLAEWNHAGGMHVGIFGPLRHALTLRLEGLGLGAHTLFDRLADRLASRRHNATVVASFALLALVLALIGVYGVTSYTVVSEAREIGIRLALGARPRGVSRLIVARTVRLVAAGLAVGLVAGLLLTRFMGSLLFDVPPNDPETFLIVAAVLLTVATLAGYLPARRAAAIDPASTLKG